MWGWSCNCICLCHQRSFSRWVQQETPQFVKSYAPQNQICQVRAEQLEPCQELEVVACSTFRKFPWTFISGCNLRMEFWVPRDAQIWHVNFGTRNEVAADPVFQCCGACWSVHYEGRQPRGLRSFPFCRDGFRTKFMAMRSSCWRSAKWRNWTMPLESA